MELNYLKHLARLGTPAIHPGGKNATGILISEMAIKDNMRILEVGCGTGETAVKIASLYNVSIESIDILPEMIKATDKRISACGLHKKIKLSKIEPGEPFPFPDSSFDRVYTESVLCFQDLTIVDNLLNEINRVLKPGGIYSANEAIWVSGVAKEIISSITEKAIKDFGLVPATADICYYDNWIKKFNEKGFDTVSAEKISPSQGHPARTNSKIIISNLFNLIYKSKIIFFPSLLREFIRYKRLIKSYARNEPALEARLFILKKKSS